MAQLDRAALKLYFETGDFPTEDQFSDLIDSLLNFIDDGTPSLLYEELIERPTTEPAIDTGTLTIDLNSKKQGLFEPRLSVGTLAINEDFNYVISNDSNGDLISSPLTLTGTRIITFESDVLVSNASTLGTWAAPNLTITAGTDDIIEFQFLKYNGNWLLKVGEVSI